MVVRGPNENLSRSAIDPLFRTAGRAFGPRVTAGLLSGLLNDGTYGLMVVKDHGGITMAQDPKEADYGDMPASTIERRSASTSSTLRAAGRQPSACRRASAARSTSASRSSRRRSAA